MFSELNLIYKREKKDRALFVQFEWNEWIGKSARILLGTVQYQHCQHKKKLHIFRIPQNSWKWLISMVVWFVRKVVVVVFFCSFFWLVFDFDVCCWSGGKMINFHTKNWIMFKATIHENECVCLCAMNNEIDEQNKTKNYKTHITAHTKHAWNVFMYIEKQTANKSERKRVYYGEQI